MPLSPNANPSPSPSPSPNLTLTPSLRLTLALTLIRYALNVLFGVGVSVCGIYFTLQDILAQSSAGVFDAACRENAFFLGSTPADAYSCANDTVFYRNFYERACVQGDIACSQYGSCYPA